MSLYKKGEKVKAMKTTKLCTHASFLVHFITTKNSDTRTIERNGKQLWYNHITQSCLRDFNSHIARKAKKDVFICLVHFS